MTKDEIILAQQARIEQLRETLQHFALIDLGRDSLPSTFGMDVLASRKALSTHDDLSALREHDENLLAPYQWQPIETAPKVGAHLAYTKGNNRNQRPYVIVWLDADHPDADGAGWYEHWNFDPVEPTHWMPLPSTDAIEKGGVL